MMKAHRYLFLTLALISLAFLFAGQALAADIDATLPDFDNTSSFQVKNSENTNNILMKVQSGGKVGIGTASPVEKLDVNGNVQISGANGKLVFPASHYDEKIVLHKGGDEKIGTANNQLKLIAGDGADANIAFFRAPTGGGSSTEVMRVQTLSGNVGINTMSPTDGKLVVKATTNDGSTKPVVIEDSDAANVFEIDSNGNTTLAGFIQESVTAGITPVSVGYQGDGPLTTGINEVPTVGASTDVVTLPTAVAGRIVRIINNGVNPLKIYPASGDDAGSGENIAVSLAGGSNVTYVAYNATNWEVF